MSFNEGNCTVNNFFLFAVKIILQVVHIVANINNVLRLNRSKKKLFAIKHKIYSVIFCYKNEEKTL